MIAIERSVDDATAAMIEAVAREAGDEDGVPPLGEQPMRSLRSDDGQGVRHLLIRGDGGGVVGYAQLAGEGGDATAEMVVAPRERRRGVGSELVRTVLELEPAAAVWAHGDLPAARALAASVGLVRTRELLKMRRSAADGPALPAIGPAEGIETGTLAEAVSEGGGRWPGLDAREELLRVNNAAFSWHPEQGGWSRGMLDQRLAVEWVDPAGVFLAVDTVGPAPRLAGFHWTKTVTEPGSPVEGEVYVVGVDPADQGRGLGGMLTSLGVAHLEGPRGAESVVLYVEGDNTAALRTYEKLGFTVEHRDVTYASE
ncbi:MULTISPECIES: mycothiol synthase [unclassified Dietzia]|uniref:mycothiol synthase n=1 Tax=unclassified Dietzia TaxID=2617939 RepID=UPI000D211AF6|nr:MULTISPECIES: mycothiol synthase [unclassified Dietzia]AVZ38727.1 mycothiol synthase [Dietzia sp. JS16-p6b]MBB1024081.1 mycothiol synthase [Dietzia sp. DQ12-76]MBB1028221.1 mycothiol synthase [Dietzia sp. DQ11-38-2]QGW23824.1 GCN5-related N-acetyltransferase [Dietzia sp. DQ12-45-1b]